MFHSARALIFSKGYREKSHYALLLALRELFEEKLENTIERFEEAMDLREEADYGLRFSEEGAIAVIEGAKRFIEKTKAILKVK